MIKFLLNIKSPDPTKDDLEFSVLWPSLPHIGQTIDLAPTGSTGWQLVVKNVIHWLGCREINVYCELTDNDPEDSFKEISGDSELNAQTQLGM